MASDSPCTPEVPPAAGEASRRAAWALATVLLFAVLAPLIVLNSADGRVVEVDEAIYLWWGLKDLPVPPDWIGMKPLASALTRELATALGPGLGTYHAIKSAYACFGLVFAAGLFFWMRRLGHAPATAALLAIVGMSTPAVLYVDGRAMGEILMLGFFAWGAALMPGPEAPGSGDDRRLLRPVGALVLFLFAYLARTTSFTLVGAYLAVECLRWALARRAEGTSRAGALRAALFSAPAAVGGGYAFVLLLMTLTLSVPVFPLSQAAGHIDLWQPPPEQGRLTFYVLAGFLGPLLVLGSLVLSSWKIWRSPLAIAWLWVLLAASPYLYVLARGSYINPRQTVDLVLPLLGVASVLAGFPYTGKSRPGRVWLSVALFACLAVVACWRLQHPVVNEYLRWYSHGYGALPRWLHWAVATALLGAVLLLWIRVTWREDAWRPWVPPGLLLLGVGMLFVQQHLAAPGMGFNSTLVAPARVAAFLDAAGVPEDEPVATALAHYEAEILMFTMPERTWQPYDAYADMAPHPAFEQPGRDARHVLLSRRALIDRPDALERILARNEVLTEARPVAEEGIWILYETVAPADRTAP